MGKAYLATVLYHEEVRRADSDKRFLASASEQELAVFGSSLSGLHQIATCFRGCKGGPHIFESLVGRAYNLSAGAFSLIRSGYYDEALNLVRSLGELANLLMLFRMKQEHLKDWLSLPDKERRKKYKPANVRSLLESVSFPPMEQSWYARLCEAATHVNPATVPNRHNTSGISCVGGLIQEGGLTTAFGDLVTMTGTVALLVSDMIGYKDIFNAVVTALRDQ